MPTTTSLLKIFFLILSSTIVSSYLPKFEADYKKAVKLSLLFYEAQRSGKLPDSNRIKWRGDSAMYDRGVEGADLTGGYYDATDFVKFSFTIAFTTTILSWGVILYKDAYQDIDEYDNVVQAIKWATDYFIKCHVSPNEFYGQVGDFSIDHDFWGRSEDMNMSRPSFKIDQEHPGSDLAGEAAAAFASASLVFSSVNKSYADELLRHAKELYNFAKTYRGLYQDAIPGAKQYYESSTYGDELVWAAAWLFKSTGNYTYYKDAVQYYHSFNVSKETSNTFYYDRKQVGIQLLLADPSQSTGDFYFAVKTFCDNAIDRETRTPEGLLYIDKFGTLAHSANVAFICLQAAELPDVPKKKYIAFAKEQIDYILGSKGRSFVVGYGYNYPKRVYHSASSCPDRPQTCNWDQYRSRLPNPQTLYGALVSGPDASDYYIDSREEWHYSEVTLDYNAGFQCALVGLIHFQNQNKSSNSTREEDDIIL